MREQNTENTGRYLFNNDRLFWKEEGCEAARMSGDGVGFIYQLSDGVVVEVQHGDMETMRLLFDSNQTRSGNFLVVRGSAGRINSVVDDPQLLLEEEAMQLAKKNKTVPYLLNRRAELLKTLADHVMEMEIKLKKLDVPPHHTTIPELHLTLCWKHFVAGSRTFYLQPHADHESDKSVTFAEADYDTKIALLPHLEKFVNSLIDRSTLAQQVHQLEKGLPRLKDILDGRLGAA